MLTVAAITVRRHSDQIVSRLVGLEYVTERVQSSVVKIRIHIWSEWRLTVNAATVRIALVDILDLSEVVIPAGVFLHPAVGWG